MDIPVINIPISNLHIRKTDNGKEYLSIKGDLAFNSTIVDEAREAGVPDEYIKAEE